MTGIALALLVLLQAAAALSLVGGLSIIGYYVAVCVERRSVTLRLITFLSVANCGTSIGFLLANPNLERMCVVSASIITFFATSSFFWSMCLAINLYVAMDGKRSGAFAKRLEYAYHAVSWLVPLVLTLIPALFDMYAPNVADSVGCWFKEDRSWARLALFDAWIVLAWLVNMITYLIALRRTRTLVMESLYVHEDPQQAEVALNNLAVVRNLLLNFVVCWTSSVVLSIMAIVEADASQPSTVWILFLFATFAPLQGFLNFTTFMTRSRHFRQRYWMFWKGLLGRLRRCVCAYEEDTEIRSLLRSDVTSINYGSSENDFLDM